MSEFPEIPVDEDGVPRAIGQFVSDGGGRDVPLALSEYQATATETAVYPGQGGFIGLAYAVLGLNGEAGETGEGVKKIWRDDAADIEGNVLAAVADAREELRRGTIAYDTIFEKLSYRVQAAFKIELSDERRAKISKELGDTLWYAAQVATELGLDLSDVAQQNLDKLAARRAANKIHGEGSDR